jgi:hypothetical protein
MRSGDGIVNDNEILLAIQELMDGVEWSTDTLDGIAKLLNDNGYRVRDLDDADLMGEG